MSAPPKNLAISAALDAAVGSSNLLNQLAQALETGALTGAQQKEAAHALYCTIDRLSVESFALALALSQLHDQAAQAATALRQAHELPTKALTQTADNLLRPLASALLVLDQVGARSLRGQASDAPCRCSGSDGYGGTSSCSC